MFDPVTLALVVIVATCAFVIFISHKLRHRGRRYPPGPTGLPLVGNALSIPARDYLYFEELKNKYGDLTWVKVGKFDFIYLNTVTAMREALVNQADVFSGRLHSEYGDKLTGGSGIIFRDGPEWHEHRRFTLKALRDLGAGRSETEEKTLTEFDYLMKELPIGEAVDVFPLFINAMNNMISQLVFGERCGADDVEFQAFQQRINDLFDRGQSVTAMLPLLFPGIMKIPFLGPAIEKHSGMVELCEFSHAYIRKKIEQHEAKIIDVDQEPEDVCDALLLERMKREASSEEGHSFTYQQLIRDLVELFIAGTDTTAVTLTWAVFMLANNRAIQEKVQAEVDSKVGRSRSVSMKDRRDMHYVNATIDEVLRFSSIVPTGIPHRCREDTQLLGYFIPKDIVIMTNLYSVHRDPLAWRKPYDFYPEHFLTDEGLYRPCDSLMAFSLGRRACLGEGLAKMELFLFFTSIFQNFDVTLGDRKADTEAIMAGKGGAQRRLLPHNVIFTTR